MIYLDNAATTKPKKEVVDVITRCLLEDWGNPSSSHALGRRAKKIVEESRKTVADLIGADPSEIIFTSGACEANSLAVFGYLQSRHSCFYTSAIEHKSIVNISQNSDAIADDVILVNSFGQVDVSSIKKLIEDDLYQPLVSIQYANNEIGTIQNIKKIADIVHQCDGVIHTDATQIIPDRKINVKKLDVDMLSFSGQKLGAPKGIGVLYVRNGIKLDSIIYGTQENGLRGGTENVPYIAGLAEAIRQLKFPTGKERDYFVNRVLSEIEDCYLVGTPIGNNRLRNNAAICFRGAESEAVLLMLDQKGICVSSGSACNSFSLEPSHVLTAIRLPKEDQYSMVRFTFGENTIEEVDIVVEELKNIVSILRNMK
ncbi:MAG: cysteine desulfurase [Bacteroides sp.]|nr:cysteine desulfurase [Eubacterium sp.]MCM1417657.1 cysteine desulfurase [Roseburia sp.]MCM1461878.1 cysteine desulfurase [Bacteroides sp.]